MSKTDNHQVSYERKTLPNGKANPKYVDLCDEDTPIAGQKFACLSFISPEKVLKKRETYLFDQFVKQWDFTKSMNKYFENVFVINRSIDKARMEKTDSILSKNNIKYKRFEAVVIKEDVNTHVTNEMLGCGLSHRNIWEYVVDNKLENVLIFEDDMFLVDEWEMQLNKAMNDLPKAIRSAPS